MACLVELWPGDVVCSNSYFVSDQLSLGCYNSNAKAYSYKAAILGMLNSSVIYVVCGRIPDGVTLPCAFGISAGGLKFTTGARADDTVTRAARDVTFQVRMVRCQAP